MKKILVFLLAIQLFSCQLQNENNATEINNKAIIHMEKGEYKLAIKLFKEANKMANISNDLQLQINRNLALTYNEAERYDSAANYFKKAALLDKEKGYLYHINMSDYQLINEDIQGGFEFCIKAYEIDSNRFEANSSLGLFYMGEYGDQYFAPQKALKHNLLAFKQNPQKHTEINVAKNYYYINDYEKSISMFQALNMKYPNDKIILESLIICAQESKKKDVLDVYMKKYEKLDPVGFQNVLNYIKDQENYAEEQ